MHISTRSRLVRGLLLGLAVLLSQAATSWSKEPPQPVPETPAKRTKLVPFVTPLPDDLPLHGVLRRCGSPLFRHSAWVPGVRYQVTPASPPHLSFSPDRETIYITGPDDVVAFNATTGERRFALHSAFNLDIRNLGPDNLRVEYLQGEKIGTFEILAHTTGKLLRSGKSTHSGDLGLTFDQGRRALEFRTRVNPRIGPALGADAFLKDVANGQTLAELGYTEDQAWAVSQDESLLAFVDDGMLLQVYATADGKQLAQLPLGGKNAREVSFPVWSPDGRLVYAWSTQRDQPELRELNVTTGASRTVVVNEFGGSATPVVSPDGKLLAYRSHNPRLKSTFWIILRLEDQAELHRVDARPAATLGIFSPDSRSFWTLSESQLARFDLETGKFDPLTAGYLEPPSALAFSQDGQKLYGVSGVNLLTWDVQTGKETAPRSPIGATVVDQPGVPCKGIADAGQTAVFARVDSNVVRLSGGKETGRFYAANGWEGREFVLTSDLRQIVHDGYYGQLLQGDLTTGKVIRELRPKSTPRHSYSLALAPDNNTLAVVHRDYRNNSDQQPVEIEIWDLAQGRIQRRLTQIGNAKNMRMLFTRDGRQLWTWHKSGIRLWDVGRGELLGTMPWRRWPGFDNLISPNRRRYINPDSRMLELIELDSGQVCRRWDHDGGQMAAWAYSPDMKFLAASANNGPVLLFDLYGTQSPQAELTPLETLWLQLADQNAARAFDAICALAQQGDAAVTFLQGKLDLKLPDNAAELIDQLDHENFQMREKASHQLREAPASIVGMLEKALEKSDSTEQQVRLKQLLAHHQVFPLSGLRLRELRAVEALEVIDTPAARTLLQDLAQAKFACPLTREAQAACARIKSLESANEQ